MKRMLAMLSLTALTVSSTASSVSVFTNSNTPKANLMNSKLLMDNYSEGVQNLSDVITTTQLGDINIPSSVTTPLQKKGYISNKLRDANPNLDMKEIDIINVTEDRAIVVPLNSWKTYTGNVQIFYNLVINDDGQWLTDINDFITDSNLGNIKLRYDYEQIANPEYIRDKIDYLNLGLWTINLVITNVTRTTAVVSGDNEVYTGSVTVNFNTLSVYQLDKELMDEAFASNWIGQLDKSNRNNWKQITEFFLRKLGENTWLGRSSMNFLAFKTAIERLFKDYFGQELTITGFGFYTGPGASWNYVDPSRFRTSYLEGIREFKIYYHCKVNSFDTPSWVSSNVIGFTNESIGLMDRYNELKGNWYNHPTVIKIDRPSLEGIIDYVSANKAKIIQDFVNSDKFKSFYYLYRQKRISVDLVYDWQNQVINQQGKLILQLTIDNLPNKWFDNAVYAYDEIHFAQAD